MQSEGPQVSVGWLGRHELKRKRTGVWKWSHEERALRGTMALRWAAPRYVEVADDMRAAMA